MRAVELKYKLRDSAEKLLEEYEHYTHTYPNPIKYERLHGTKNITNAFFQILRTRNKIPDYKWFWEEYLKAHLEEVKLNPYARRVSRKYT